MAEWLDGWMCELHHYLSRVGKVRVIGAGVKMRMKCRSTIDARGHKELVRLQLKGNIYRYFTCHCHHTPHKGSFIQHDDPTRVVILAD